MVNPLKRTCGSIRQRNPRAISPFPGFRLVRDRSRSAAGAGVRAELNRADPRPPDIGIINLTDNPMMDMYLIDMYFDPIESASSRRGVTRRR